MGVTALYGAMNTYVVMLSKTGKLCWSLIELPGHRAREANPGPAVLTLVILYRLSGVLNYSLRFQQFQLPTCK